MNYIGIDPGKSGALAVILPEAIELFTFDESDYANVLFALGKTDCRCCLERVGAMPGQGVTSMFHFGENYGLIRGLLQANQIPYEIVTPQRWKREFGITDKNGAIAVCERLFPEASLYRTPRCKKPSDGLAEALLMAEYARRRM